MRPEDAPEALRCQAVVWRREGHSEDLANALQQAGGGGHGVFSFWLKARAGKREKHDVEISARDGKPLEPTVIKYCWADAPAAPTPTPIDPNTTTTIEHDEDAD